jgi:hypothetical protein
MTKNLQIIMVCDSAPGAVEIFDDMDLCTIVDASPKVGDDGILRVNARFARTGVQNYYLADGTLERRYRPADEVFANDSLASWAMRTVTSDHPPVMVDSANAKQFMVGMTGETAWQDGKFVVTRLAIADKNAISDIVSGRRRQLSAGYRVALDHTPGVSPEGEAYDVVMRQITGNHIALVAAARGGSELKPQLDAPDKVAVADNNKTPSKPLGGGTTMAKMMLNGVERDVPDGVVDAIQGEISRVRGEVAAKVATLEGELAGAKAKVTAKDAEIKAIKDSAPDPQLALDAARGRIALEAKAREVLGADTKFEAKDSDDSIRRKVLGKLAPTTVLDNQDAAFVAGMFEALIANRTPTVDHAGNARRSAIEDAKPTHSASGMTTDKDGVRKPVMTVDSVDRANRANMTTSHMRPLSDGARK